MSISKKLKKLLSMLTVVCMICTLIPATVSFAGSSDVVSVGNYFDSSVTDAQKAAILGTLWDYAAKEAKDGEPMSVSDVVYYVEKSLGSIKDNVIGDGTGKISEATVETLAGKVLNYREEIAVFYNIFEETIESKVDTTDKVALYQKLYSAIEPVVSYDSSSDKFEELTDAQSVVSSQLSNLGFDKITADSAVKFLFAKDADTKLSYYDRLVNKLNSIVANSTYKFDPDDVAEVLRAYKICTKKSTTPTTSPTTTPAPTSSSSSGSGSSGNGGAAPAPSSSTAPTLSDVTKTLDSALSDIAKLDAAKAADKVAAALTGLNDLATDKLTIADETALQEKAQALIDAVMNKVTAQTAAPEVTGDTATAKVADITSAIDAIVAAADKLSASVDASKLDVSLEKTLVLNAQSGKDVVTSAVELPAKVVAAADKLDSVVLKTDVATITINPKDLGNGKEDVTVKASKASVPEEYKAVVGDNLAVDFSIKAGDKAISNFSKAITVSIPYTLRAGEDKNSITVFYVGNNGKLENVAGYYDETAKAVVFTTKHFSLYMVKANPVDFADVNDGDWYKNIVDTMASKGVILGYAGGNFMPDNNITRAEFAALLVRGFKLSDNTAVNSFSDIDSSDWFVNDVASAAKTGIVSGVGNGAFAPDENITRQDMAVMISRALKVVKSKSGEVASTSTDLFKDYSDIASYAQAGVASAAKYGIIKGRPDGSFAPKADATRAEAATMIYNLFFLK